MQFEPRSIRQLLEHPYDEVVDVRAPTEFAEDHLPGAVNLPVLDDEERARVGTEYAKVSRFGARRTGAALAARNIAGHLEAHFADKGGGYRPLVYCWRGGMRSAAMADVLSKVGWRVDTLAGGYRTYRKFVSDFLYEGTLGVPVVLLDGNTGTGKTEVLGMLRRHGIQTLDLERLANHSGSLFGARDGPQPSQKAFESALALEIAALDESHPVVVEAESSRIGDRIVPPLLWKAMLAAPRIELAANAEDRAGYLASRFKAFERDRMRLRKSLAQLDRFHSKATLAGWMKLADSGSLAALAGQLMELHYDPRYRKHRADGPQSPQRLELKDLSEAGLASAAADVADIVRKIARSPA